MQWTCELLPLLEDVSFRIVSQQGLATSTDYQAVVSCLKNQFSPDGNELEWQFSLQQRTQKPKERLIEFSGALGQLADKAYPNWSGEQRQEIILYKLFAPLTQTSCCISYGLIILITITVTYH